MLWAIVNEWSKEKEVLEVDVKQKIKKINTTKKALACTNYIFIRFLSLLLSCEICFQSATEALCHPLTTKQDA